MSECPVCHGTQMIEVVVPVRLEDWFSMDDVKEEDQTLNSLEFAQVNGFDMERCYGVRCPICVPALPWTHDSDLALKMHVAEHRFRAAFNPRWPEGQRLIQAYP